uniref:Mastermind like domain containing 1 n=1 Tax=Chelonoidis abingdonii TaxID=106734 RepID=A0A8C0J671_CHEAB
QLQGSIKRKLEDDSSPASSGMPDVIFPSDNKRLCLDDVTLSMGQETNPSVSCPDMQNSPFSTNHSTSSMGVAGHSALLENNHMNGSGIGSPFSVPPNTEIGQKGTIGGQNNVVHYDEKGNNMQSVDQELQDLLEELTKMPDPSPNELDLEKILGSKAEEPLGLSHPQSSISTTPKSSPQTSHLENHIANKDFSPGCNPTSGGSPQMRPPSVGANYPVPPPNKAVASPISSGAQNKNQAQSILPVPLPNMPTSNWHAQQLKQLAASKQVPGSSPLHQPFSPQNVMVMASGNNPSSGPSPPYGSEKLSSPALNQQPFSPQNSMLSNMTSTSLPTNNIKSPQNNLVPSMASTNTGPSPTYRPEKLSSPALHQQPFNQFSFNNTKPLSHFASESTTPKMSPMTANPGQQSLIHYLQQQQHAPATQQSPQANNTPFIEQHLRQLMQPPRMQRHMQPAALPSQPRQVRTFYSDQNPGIVTRLQEPGTIPSGGSVPAPATVNGYTMRNHLLKQQIMRRQLMQVRLAQHLRQPSMPRISTVYPSASAQMWTPTGVSRMPNQSQMDTSMQQFSSNPLVSKQNVRPNISGQQFSHQAVAPPNQIVPGVQVRQMQKLNLGQSGQNLSTLNNQNLRHNLTRGPLSALNVMKSMPQGMSSFNQLNPAQGLCPPSYPSTGQLSGTFNRMSTASELPQYDFVPQQSNSILPGNCSETDFIDSLMKNSSNNDEDWLNNLTMIDDILGQHAQNSGHV